MKSNLDALMHRKNIDALIVMGNATHNPPMYYLTGGGHVSSALLIKKCGGEPVLFCNDMEREEAARSGLKVVPFSAYNYEAALKEAGGDPALASAIRLKQIFMDNDIHGRVGVYGITDLGSAFVNFTQLQDLAAAITPVPGGVGVLTIAMLLNNTVQAAERFGNKLVYLV